MSPVSRHIAPLTYVKSAKCVCGVKAGRIVVCRSTRGKSCLEGKEGGRKKIFQVGN